MPQVSPMYWTILFLTSLFFFLMTIMKIYYK